MFDQSRVSPDHGLVQLNLGLPLIFPPVQLPVRLAARRGLQSSFTTCQPVHSVICVLRKYQIYIYYRTDSLPSLITANKPRAMLIATRAVPRQVMRNAVMCFVPKVTGIKEMIALAMWCPSKR